MSHLDEDQLFRFVLGQLTTADATAVEAHLAACAECRHRKDNLSSLVFASTLTPAPAPPGSKPPQPATTKPDAPGSRAASAAVTAQGSSFGRYHLMGRLGAGGMGEVFAAFDPQLDRRVALKLLRAGALSASEGKARLVREAQAMARLQHPNVATVHDVGEVDEHVFVAMEFVEGETLGEWLRGDRTWEQIVAVFLQAGAGLAAAHQAGLVHRDFKPDNVLIGKDGRPRVVDFGLARQTTSSPPAGARPGDVPESEAESPLNSRLTRDGAVMGTPGYMAPEQLAGLPTDARCDQFAFCVALFEGLYGKRPFGGATLKQHAQEISQGKVPTPPATSLVPSRIYDVVKRGLQANPADRWPDMTALLLALQPGASVPRRRLLIATLAAALLVAAWAGWTQQRLQVCAGFDQRLVNVWDEAKKKELHQALLSTGVPWAESAWKGAERSLNAWTQEWLQAARTTCEDGRLRRTDTEEVYEFKTACLEGRLQRLSALTRLLATADKEIASNAASAAHALDPVAGCFDLAQMARVGKVSAQDKAADDALKLAVAEARALFDAGKYAAGVHRLEQALTAGGPPRTRADALLWLGRLRVRAGDGKKASADFLAASAAALETQDAALQAMAFSRLGGTTGFDQESAGADAWLALARAAGSRVRDDWEVQAELATNEALVAMARKQFKEALAGFQAVLAAQEQHLGPTSSAVAMTLNNLGVANSNLGLFAEAITRYERSLAVHRAQEGDDHPNTASAENNLAFVLRRLGRYGEAATHYRRVFEVRKQALGPTHPETLKTAEALAMVSIATGNSELALDLLEEALAAHQKATGPESREVANLYDDLSELYARGQYWKEAARYADLELEVARKVGGERSLLAARALLAQGEVHTHLGDWAAAAKALEDCLSIRLEKAGADSHEVAVALNAQGDLALAQRHAAEALALYARARDTRTRAGPGTPEALAGDLLRTGRALVQVDRAVEAVAPLREAQRLRQGVEDPTGLATVEFELGRALWLANEAHHAEARPLLLQAVAALSPGERREAEAWLAQQAVAPVDAGSP